MRKEAKSLIENLSVIKEVEMRYRIVNRCGTNLMSDGLQCPHCGVNETYKDAYDTENTDKWFFVISAFKVDNSSKCSNCNTWFES